MTVFVENHVGTRNTTADPQKVGSLAVSDVLMHEVMSAAGIPVDASSRSPVAPYRHPSKGRRWDHLAKKWENGKNLEAFVVNAVGGSQSKLLRIARDDKAAHGWDVSEPFPDRHPQEVLAAYDPGTSKSRCYMLEGRDLYSGNLFVSTMDHEGRWGPPSKTGDDFGVEGLRVSYMKGSGRPFVHAKVMEDSPNWYSSFLDELFTTPVHHDLSARLAYVEVYENSEKRYWAYVGSHADGEEATGVVVSRSGNNEFPMNRVDTVRNVLQVVEGVGNVEGNQAYFLVLHTDGTFSNVCVDARNLGDSRVHHLGGGLVYPVLGKTKEERRQDKFKSVVTRLGVERDQYFLDIYATSERGQVWVIRQDRKVPWRDGGDPNWKSPVPIDGGVEGVAVTSDRSDETAMFTWDSGGGHLRLQMKDGRTRLWRKLDVLPPKDTAQLYESTVHRVEVLARNADGGPVAGKKVTFTAKSESPDCDAFWQDGKKALPTLVTITGGGLELETDACGRVVLSIRADSVTGSELTACADGVSQTVRPGRKVLDYLLGNGSIREADGRGALPTFSADALQNLSSQASEQDRKDAYANMRNAAGVGLGKDIKQFGNPSGGTKEPDDGAMELGGWWSDLAGDVWNGIKQGVATVDNWVRKGGQILAEGLKWLGKEALKGGQLVIKGLYDAGHAIAGMAKKLVKDVQDVVNWVKSVLDFGAIWRTKQAFEEVLRLFFPKAVGEVATQKKKIDTWLTQERDAIKAKLDQAIKAYGSTSIGNETGNDQVKQLKQQSSDPQTGWLTDKVKAAGPPDKPPDITVSAELNKAWEDLQKNLAQLKKDGQGLVDKLLNVGENLFKNPSGITSIGDVLELVKAAIDVSIDVGKTLIDGIADLVAAALAWIYGVLTKPLNVPQVLKSLWEWAVKAGGGKPSEEPLTFAALIALLGAVPTTIVYKIAHAGEEPFPSGGIPDVTNSDRAARAKAVEVCMWVSASLGGLISWVMAMWSDVMGPDTPKYVGYIGLVNAVVAFGLAHAGWLKYATPINVTVLIFTVIATGTLIGALIAAVLDTIGTAAAMAAGTWLLPWVLTGMGVMSLLYYGYRASVNNFPTLGLAVSGAIGPLSLVTAFMNTEAMRAQEWPVPAKIVIDGLSISESSFLNTYYTPQIVG
ncbi:hypothetical protein [Streptomyces sp. NPDC046261]|uniref:hypothetical protein n=1 Tax=Streptomyces sp. NPDC046261 TaxID=3157200 RepID=UPI0033C52342